MHVTSVRRRLKEEHYYEFYANLRYRISSKTPSLKKKKKKMTGLLQH